MELVLIVLIDLLLRDIVEALQEEVGLLTKNPVFCTQQIMVKLLLLPQMSIEEMTLLLVRDLLTRKSLELSRVT